jgi:hypothetical protein
VVQPFVLGASRGRKRFESQPFFQDTSPTDLPRARINSAAVKCGERSELNGIAQRCYKIFKRRLAKAKTVKVAPFGTGVAEVAPRLHPTVVPRPRI